MRTMKWLPLSAMLLLSTAQAATTGRVIVDQTADPDRQREAVRTELKLTQAFAFPRSWVSEETRWSVLVVPAEVDLAGLRGSRDPESWVSDYVHAEHAIALQFMIDSDGDVVEMNVYDRGKLQLGASGTMGQVQGPRIEANRLRGHYVNFADLFGSTLAFDLQVDAEIWQAPKASPLPLDGGAPGAAYLALIKAVQAGDRAGIAALQPKDRPQLSAEEFAQMLPMMQATLPKKPQILGGKQYGDTAILSVADGASKEPASAELRREGDHWVMVRASSGVDRGADAPLPPSFAETTPDLCPTVIKEGVVCGDVTWKDEAFAIRQVLAIQSEDDQHLVLLAPDKLDPTHAQALWDSEAPIEPLFGKAPVRGLLLSFGGAQGALSADSGYHIDPEDGFTEEFMLRGEAVRIGDRLYGAFAVNQTNPDTGDTKLLQILRFEAPVYDKR